MPDPTQWPLRMEVFEGDGSIFLVPSGHGLGGVAATFVDVKVLYGGAGHRICYAYDGDTLSGEFF